MKTILLTGGTGFFGSHLARRLSQEYKIIILKRSYSSLSRIEDIAHKIVFFDVDKKPIEEVFLENAIDIIIHTATQYGRTYESLVDIVEANLDFPLTLVELGIRHGVQAFLNTDTFWGENIELPIGLKYYALTKRDFLKYSTVIIEEYNTMKFLNLKMEHLYGPWDNPKKFIPSILISFLQNASTLSLTKGEQLRDFIYVEDAAAAYEFVLGSTKNMQGIIHEFDIGTGQVFTIREIVERAKEITGASTELLFGVLEYRKGESMEVRADITSLAALGWKSHFSLEDGLQETIKSLK